MISKKLLHINYYKSVGIMFLLIPSLCVSVFADPVSSESVRKKYYPDGKTVLREESYRNKVLHGVVREYHENGQLNVLSNYRDGKMHGTQIMYHEDGGVISEEKYEDGRLLNDQDEFYSGEKSYHYPDGSLFATTAYLDGFQHGETRIYYPTGELKIEMQAKKGKYIGRATKYFPSGEIQAVGQMSKGKINGVYKEYFESGKIRAIIPFRRGNMHGKARLLDEEGNLIVEVKFDNDIAKYRLIGANYREIGNMEAVIFNKDMLF